MTKSKVQNPNFQKTIKHPFSIVGIGIHSGKPSQIKVNPAPENFGLIFVKEGKEIRASIENVVDTRLGTSLKGIKTVEHFLAAAKGLGIDNLLVEVKGEEIPILDGSALPFAQKFLEAQIVEQDEVKSFLKVSEKIEVTGEDKKIVLSPADNFEIEFVVDYPVIGKQEKTFREDPEIFLKEIAPARTFGFVEDLEKLKAEGFARGAGLDCALAISRGGYLNPPRFPDEVVRHKILDLIGDLALLGFPLKGKIKALKSSHRLNLELVKILSKMTPSQPH